MDHNTSSQFSVLSSQGRRGYTLLFAILVMGIVSIATINLASIVLRSLRSAHDLDDATVALYAAESGNEEALYFLGQGASCASLTTGAEIALSMELRLSVCAVMLHRCSFAPLEFWHCQNGTSSKYRYDKGRGRQRIKSFVMKLIIIGTSTM